MKKLTPTEQEFVSFLSKAFRAKGINTDAVPAKTWKKFLGESPSPLRIPRKLLETFTSQDGSVNFTALFGEYKVQSPSVSDFFDQEETADIPQEEGEELAVDTRESRQLGEPEEKDSQEIHIDIPKDMVEPESDTVMKRILTPNPKRKKQSKTLDSFANPVYVVEGIDCSEESNVIGVTKTFDIAYNMRELILHDHGDLEYTKAEKMIEEFHHLIITSNTSKHLRCRIRKIELN